MDILCINVIRTSEVFSKLNKQHFKNFKVTLAIAKLSKELNDYGQFVAAEERKILLKYMKKNADGTDFLLDKNNNIQIEDQSKIVDLNREMDEFHQNVLEIKSIDSKIVFTSQEGLSELTPQDIMIIDNFVEFDFPEEKVMPDETKPQA